MIKKLLAAVLAVAMVMGLTAVSFASTTTENWIKDRTDPASFEAVEDYNGKAAFELTTSTERNDNNFYNYQGKYLALNKTDTNWEVTTSVYVSEDMMSEAGRPVEFGIWLCIRDAELTGRIGYPILEFRHFAEGAHPSYPEEAPAAWYVYNDESGEWFVPGTAPQVGWNEVKFVSESGLVSLYVNGEKVHSKYYGQVAAVEGFIANAYVFEGQEKGTTFYFTDPAYTTEVESTPAGDLAGAVNDVADIDSEDAEAVAAKKEEINTAAAAVKAAAGKLATETNPASIEANAQMIATVEKLYAAANGITVNDDTNGDVVGAALNAEADDVVNLSFQYVEETPAVPSRYEDIGFGMNITLTVDGAEVEELSMPVTVKFNCDVLPENPVVLCYDGTQLVDTLDVVDAGNSTAYFVTSRMGSFVLVNDTEYVPAARRTMSEAERLTLEFWNEVIAQIKAAEAGETVDVKTPYYVQWMPVRVIDALKAADDVTLSITHRGTHTTLDEVKAYEPNRIYYPMDTLAALYQ